METHPESNAIALNLTDYDKSTSTLLPTDG